MIKKRLGYVGLGMAFILMTGCSKDTPLVQSEGVQPTNEGVEETINSSEKEQVIESTGPERKGLKDALKVKYFGEDSFELAVTDVVLTDDRNSYSEKEVENVALITVSGKNISTESQMLSDSYFAFYDETGTKLDSYPVSSGKYSSIEEVSPGRQATIEFAIGIKSGSSIEIEVTHVGDNKPFVIVDPSVEGTQPLQLEGTTSTLTELNIGDVLTVQYFGNDSFELSVTEVTLTDDRNSYSEKEIENVALITVSGKNISTESQMLSDSYFAFYDETGTKLDSYPVSSGKYSSIEEVSPGRQATIEFAVGIKSGSSIEIELCHVGESQPFGLIKFQP